MSKYISYIIIGIIIIPVAAGMNSCEIINPEEEIPSYIRIREIDLTTDYITEGTDSHNITDTWVYIDDKIIGVYEMPVTLPILYAGTHKLTVRAGIKVNGMGEMRDKYPFFNSYTKNVNLLAGNVIEITPVVQYFDETIFAWIEDFEQPGISLDTTGRSDTTIQVIPNDSLVYEGNYSAAIYLDDTRSFFECIATPGQFILPKGNPVFLEINYKCNNEFVVGIYKNTLFQSVQIYPSLIIRPSDQWNKIYVNLTNEVKAQTDAISYEIYFAASKDASVTLAEVYLDNIKLVHY